MNGLTSMEEFKTVVDDSHRYTDVMSDGFRGPGEAYHSYLIRMKDGSPLNQIKFQNGPIKEAGVNGVMDENLIAIVIDRLSGFQSGKYSCQENGEALNHLQIALDALKARTQRRISEGKEGTHKV